MKTYKIKKIGVHDGYKSMERELKGLVVVPLLGGPHFREDDEEVVLRKGATPTVTKLGGTYYGEFSIPELQIQQTHFSEVYLTISDTDKPDEQEEDGENKKLIADIDAQIAELLRKRSDIPGAEVVVTEKLINRPVETKIKQTSMAEAAKTLGEAKKITEKTGIGYLVVEDDSDMPKDAPESGWKKTDKDGEPILDQPGEEPAFAPVPEEAKQAKFDRAEEVAEAKKQEEINEKMAKVRAAKGAKK